MSTRAAEYRQLVEDVIAGGLLEDDEIADLREMLANAEANMLANIADAERNRTLPIDLPQEFAE